ncbi:hypothetical protein HRW14_09505 [Streptomyces lunaelactis]|nr:hypothetical protein [Streptomyces lunaelactis]NUK50522.1 hypothetical protein [Streptomyces lunaelactis]NUK66792.1 hypothetical protein [Streptomyces lunaelactis]
MLIMDAVLETYEAADFALWPIADSPADRLLALSGQLSPREVGTAMAILTNYNKGHRERRAHDPEDSMEQVRRLVTNECVIAPGGLRIRDTATEVTAPPGCCFGMENWRDWLDLMNGEEPWLGHDPAPGVERVGEIIRLWPDADRPEGLPIDIPRAQLPELLGSVQDELVRFLTSVEQWATQYVPALAAAVVAKLDEGLVITAPLPDAQG